MLLSGASSSVNKSQWRSPMSAGVCYKLHVCLGSLQNCVPSCCHQTQPTSNALTFLAPLNKG